MTEATTASTKPPTTTSERVTTEFDARRKYQPLIELGRGGMAIVHAALARGISGFSKLVVIETIRSDAFSDNDRGAVKAFVNEARLSARMNHPNVVQVYEVCREAKLPVIVMEYLDGQSLASIHTRAFADPAYSVEMAVTIICRVLAGLHYAHQLTDYDGSPLQIVHRDVSPHNVMITYDGQVKLLDFGIAKLQGDGAKTKTKTGIVKGKIAYMPPEQLAGQDLDCRADIFSAGVMLWEAVSRRRLWGTRTDIEIIRCLAGADIPVPSEELSGSDSELARICRKAMAANPEQRYATAEEFLNDLQQFLASRTAVVQQQDIGRLVSQLWADERLEAQQRLRSELAKFARTGPAWTDALYEFERLVSARPPARRERRWSLLWLGLGGALTLAATASVWVVAPGPSAAATRTPAAMAAVPIPTHTSAVPPKPAPQEVAKARQIHVKDHDHSPRRFDLPRRRGTGHGPCRPLGDGGRRAPSTARPSTGLSGGTPGGTLRQRCDHRAGARPAALLCTATPQSRVPETRSARAHRSHGGSAPADRGEAGTDSTSACAHLVRHPLLCRRRWSATLPSRVPVTLLSRGS